MSFILKVIVLFMSISCLQAHSQVIDTLNTDKVIVKTTVETTFIKTSIYNKKYGHMDLKYKQWRSDLFFKSKLPLTSLPDFNQENIVAVKGKIGYLLKIQDSYVKAIFPFLQGATSYLKSAPAINTSLTAQPRLKSFGFGAGVQVFFQKKLSAQLVGNISSNKKRNKGLKAGILYKF